MSHTIDVSENDEYQEADMAQAALCVHDLLDQHTSARERWAPGHVYLWPFASGVAIHSQRAVKGLLGLFAVLVCVGVARVLRVAPFHSGLDAKFLGQLNVVEGQREAKGQRILHRHGICLDSGGGSVYMWRCSSALSSQQWTFVDLGEDGGLLRNGEGQCLAAPREGDAGGQVLVEPCGTSEPRQQWRYHELLGWLTNARHCLDTPQAYRDLSPLRLRPCSQRSLSMQWDMGGVVLGPGFLQNLHGKCLEAFDDSGIQPCDHDNPSQQWVFFAESGQVRNLHGACLEAPGPDVDGTKVRARACDTRSPRQRWQYDERTGRVFNKHGKCLDCPKADQAGVRPQLWSCSDGNPAQQWRLGHSSELALPGLFCFAVAAAMGGDLELLRVQRAHGIGLFGCSSWMVMSDQATQLGPSGPETTAINVSASHLWQGPQGSLMLNVNRFQAAWHAVLADGRFKSHSWVVKVDPDAVFFPARLSHVLSQFHWSTPSSGGYTYFQNCAQTGKSLSLAPGPIEVFSRSAIEQYGKSEARCREQVNATGLSEDMYMDACMKLLGVEAESLAPFLRDLQCGRSSVSCADNTTVVFHPFAATQAYMRCHEASSP